MAGRSTSSSLTSSTDFSSSRVASNGNGGVVSSVIWLTVATGLCFPWLLEKPSASKAGDSPKAVAWFLMLALDLMVGTMSVFSLWFQRSTLSIMLLIWGSCAILGTFLVGSFAMLPAVATMCCCAPDVCVMGAADTTALDDSFCRVPLGLCMETRWSLWCYYVGILLAMIAIVLLVNSVALHNKTLLECERLKKEAAKAARAAQRARRRRQDLWEQEVYGGYAAAAAAAAAAGNSAQTAHDRSISPNFADENTSTSKGAHRRDESSSNNLIAAPSFQSPMFSPARCASAPPVEADPEMGPSGSVSVVPTADANAVGVRARIVSPINASPLAPLAPLTPLSPLAPLGGDEEGGGQRFGSPTSVPSSSLSGREEEKDDETSAVGAYGDPACGGGGGAGGGRGRGNCRSGIEEDGRMIRSWGRRETSGGDVMMSWVADDEHGGGRITPKTALRFKTSALARAMRN